MEVLPKKLQVCETPIRRSSKVLHLSQTSSVHTKNPFEFVVETARLAKQDEPSFAKKWFAKHYEPPSTHYSWCVPTCGFVRVL